MVSSKQYAGARLLKPSNVPSNGLSTRFDTTTFILALLVILDGEVQGTKYDQVTARLHKICLAICSLGG